MAFLRKYRKEILDLSLIYLVFMVARVLFITVMPHTYSKDLYGWLNIIDVLKRGDNPYSATGHLNYPPFWIQVLYWVSVISRQYSLSAISLLQGVLITGEALLITPLYIALSGVFFYRKRLLLLLAGIALNPVCILLTCQHCNFDVFAGLWILLAVLALSSYCSNKRPEHWLAACLCVGMGILTKTVPVILAPMLLSGIKERNMIINLLGSVLAFLPISLGMGTIYVLAPAGVTENVISYRSMPGWYGLTGLLHLANQWPVIMYYLKCSPWLISGTMAFTALRFFKAGTMTPDRILLTALLLLMGIPTFGPGYSPPYYYWFVPLLILAYAISSTIIRRVIIAGYIIISFTYIAEYAVLGSHGQFLPLIAPATREFCNRLDNRDMQVILRLPMFIAYLAVFFLLLRRALALRRMSIG